MECVAEDRETSFAALLVLHYLLGNFVLFEISEMSRSVLKYTRKISSETVLKIRLGKI